MYWSPWQMQMQSWVGMHPFFFGFGIVVLAFWSLAWKGWALWLAARNRNLGWFLLFLLVNLLGIPEIIYIYFFADRRPADPVHHSPHDPSREMNG